MRTDREVIERIRDLRREKANLKPNGLFESIAALQRRSEIKNEIKGLMFALGNDKDYNKIIILN